MLQQEQLLLCLTLFSWHVRKQQGGILGRFGFYLCLISALLLLFSPLYANNQLRFWGLLVVTALCFGRQHAVCTGLCH